MLKRLHGRLVDTLELFFNHDGCRSGCDAFRRNIDTVPCQTKNFTDSHTACKGRVDSQLQMGIIANIKCEKNVSASQTSRFLGYSLRNSGVERWVLFEELPFNGLGKCAPQQTVDLADCRRLNETSILCSALLGDMGNSGGFQEFLIIFLENVWRYFAQIHLTDDWINVIPYQSRV